MHYTDAPDAQNQLMNFIRLCEEHAIPAIRSSSLPVIPQLTASAMCSTGITTKCRSRSDERAFHDAGMHLAANIKPCLLQDHPHAITKWQKEDCSSVIPETDEPERSQLLG
ncbi:hypothetical protein MJ589_04220 [Escherichia coli]|nr:hypothetical protein MJ589_04220 [Escherichia coli]